MKLMKARKDKNQAELLELCQDLTEHVKLLRDFAVNPGSTWLARHELSKASQLLGEIETVLTNIEAAHREDNL